MSVSSRPFRRPVRYISPLADFLRTEAAGGALLLGAAVVALVWANTAPASYLSFWHAHAGVDVAGWGIDFDVRHWVNEGLMTVFFLVVGLEIKRELTDGELRDPRGAALPFVAALGGMAVPAVIYTVINAGGSTAGGWAIPMATDIAMAVGVLALLGPRVPVALKLFLLALAIVDDIGSVIVIAVFYGKGLSVVWGGATVGLVVAIAVLKRLGVQIIGFYAVMGAALWYCTYRAGVHATLAGVACGLLAPSKPFLDADLVDVTALADVSSYDAVAETVRLARQSVSVVEWLEHRLVPWSSYAVVPLFALANAGIPVGLTAVRDSLGSPVGLGVVAGLLLGKPVGITLFSWIGVRAGWVSLPHGVRWPHIVGAAALGGIGFTVSLFIASLSFESAAAEDQARLSILVATVAAAFVGSIILRRTTNPPDAGLLAGG